MKTISLTINGKAHSLEIDPATPLLWALRDHLGMTGTKFGCGIAQCGACTVHLDGVAMRSCSVPVEYAEGKQLTTIEGLSESGDHRLQQLWVEMNVPQCGYCQAGMLMAAADLLQRNPTPSGEEVDAAMTNICRCGTYPRIRAAILRAAGDPQAVVRYAGGEA
ncbi:(2Fe-2S)-binding protein [Mangrovimicrobium sediminis]|uniref:(2Fe-2S)-binding protein n=1 Tax=Mangrovimicrobium sediminis TaxID=2562682 RepID=A0A4Z0M1G9_9GAMM|nr:(2Fe-2S)-binding protein [Haliea sp. SAOS-164]TGD73286.1 (2Fe-2S)-binding protein [Haliea sp. SAOS-164]